MKIDKHEIGQCTTYFIVEEGQANLGNFKFALKMVDIVSQTGADAIEFQLAKASDFYIQSHKGYKIYLEREFSDSQLAELSSYTQEKGLNLIVSPLTSKMIDKMAKNGCSAFNVNASDLVNPDVLDAVSNSGIPFFLSLLLAEESEIEWAINRITQNSSPQFAFMLGQHTMASGGHGVSPEHTNLGYINTLKQKYNVPVGFIDHTPNIWMPAVATAAGADMISKHMALSRDDKGPDWQVCLEPDEMIKAVSLVREIAISLNNKEKTLAPGENFDKTKMRKSIVSARKIEKGEIITHEDIKFKRPGTGISPAETELLLGKQVVRAIMADELISLGDVKIKPENYGFRNKK